MKNGTDMTTWWHIEFNPFLPRKFLDYDIIFYF